MTTLEIRKEASGLCLPERIQLADEHWDDIASYNKDWILTNGRKVGLDRRFADFDRNPRDGIHWRPVAG